MQVKFLRGTGINGTHHGIGDKAEVDDRFAKWLIDRGKAAEIKAKARGDSRDEKAGGLTTGSTAALVDKKSKT